MNEISATPEGSAAGPNTYSTLQPAPLEREERVALRSVASAAQTLNDAHFAGEGREVTFSFDQITRQPVVKVVETSTREVVQQWPPEYLLHLAAEVKNEMRDSG